MRYSVNAPTDTGETSYHLGSALTPHLTRPAASWSSRGPIAGFPGTMGIVAPSPQGVPQDVTAMASTGRSRSSDAPNRFYPSLYWVAGADQERAPVSVKSDNQMPVPAVRPANVVVFDTYTTRKGGQRQVIQPQVVQRWLGMRGTNSG
jgi:hypothetical protein